MKPRTTPSRCPRTGRFAPFLKISEATAHRSSKAHTAGVWRQIFFTRRWGTGPLDSHEFRLWWSSSIHCPG